MGGAHDTGSVKPSQEDGRKEERTSQATMLQLFACPAKPGDRVSVASPATSFPPPC